MTTASKRILVTPSPRTSAALREMSRITGRPMASYVRELLDEATPVLEQTIKTLRDVMQAQSGEEADMAFSAFMRQMAAKAKGITAEVQQAELDLDAAMKRKTGPKPGAKAAKAARGREARLGG